MRQPLDQCQSHHPVKRNLLRSSLSLVQIGGFTPCVSCRRRRGYCMTRMSVALFNDHARAEPIRQRLAQAGIPAEIHDELRHEKLWMACKADCGVRLEVPADQFERAEDMLVEWDTKEGALRDAIHCPECGSLRVEYPQYTRKSLLTNL